MDYPNVMAPSPQEIYASLKSIPNTPQGKQMLSQLVQQGQKTGSVEGSIAAALLNNYNNAQPPAPMPQGNVSQQVVARAQPAMPAPSMMGIGAPGLEQMAQQQHAQRMATGGLVAFAHGGNVRGFDEGGLAGLSNAWSAGAPQVPGADSTMDFIGDLQNTPTAAQTPAQLPDPTQGAAPRRTLGAGDSGHHSMDERIDKYMSYYGVMPDVAAELAAQHDKRKAEGSGERALNNALSMAAGYLSSYGSGQHRLGAGLASLVGTMGAQQAEDAKEQELMDKLYAQSRMQPYTQRASAVNTLLSSDTAMAKQAREEMQKQWEAQYGRGTELGKIGAQNIGEMAKVQAQIAGGKDIQGMRGESAENVANIQARARQAEALAKKGGMTPSAAASIAGAILAADPNVDNFAQNYPALMQVVKGQLGGYTPFNEGSDWGESVDTGLGFPVYMK